MKRIAWILVLLALVFRPGPAAAFLDTPTLTVSKEKEIGAEFDQKIHNQMAVLDDPVVVSFVRKMVDRIVEAKDPMPFNIKSRVVLNPALNAFAIPGGYIYIFTGLIESVATESELAGVVSHELAHVSQRHIANRLEKASKVNTLTMAGMLAGAFLGVAGGGSQSGKLAQGLMVGSQAAGTAAMLTYSQQDERDADHVGLNSLVKAGYNPEGMPATFQTMLKKQWYAAPGENGIPAYLSTHPGLSERIGYLEDRIRRLPPDFTKRKDDNEGLFRVQALLRGRYDPPTIALGYYENRPENEYSALDWMGYALALERARKSEQSSEAMNKAVAMDGSDPLVLREAGALFTRLGDFGRAAGLLQKAAFVAPDDPIILLRLGELQLKRKKYKEAEAYLNQAVSHLRRNPAVYMALGRTLGESGDLFGGHLNLGWGYVYSKDYRKARLHADKAAQLAKTEEQKKKAKELRNSF
ncbi:beta-barrel assembly-enhancing protease [Salidesulfovibrio brasiliensis]